MTRVAVVAGVLALFAGGAAAQGAIPPGTLVPVSLDTGLKAGRMHAGQAIRATVEQSVPGTPVRRHAHVVGHVVRVDAGGNGPERLELRFDAVEVKGQRIPLTAGLRAVASFLEVEEAEAPEAPMTFGDTPENTTSRQIGGERVYRGGGPVARGLTTVGTPVPYGVLAAPRANPEGGCRGVVGGADRPQALWLFSTDACGVYGLPGVRIEHAGRSEPVGTVVLVAERGKMEIREGAGMLLRVE